MTATLTLDEAGRLVLPAEALRVLGMAPGDTLRADVTPKHIETLGGPMEDVPVISQVSSDGLPVIPAELKRISAMDIVSAIKAEREERERKIARR